MSRDATTGLTPMKGGKPLKMIDPNTPVPAALEPCEARLAELGIVLPQPAAPVAAYVPTVLAGGLLHVSGQLPFKDGHLMLGRVGDDRTVEFATEAAQACGVMLLAQVKAALGSLEKVERIVKLGVFINSSASFMDQPKVANGASELMVAVFGDAGKHARSAVGVPTLPLGAVVEVDAVVAVRMA
jgi:enamine deaminase RidA (YjgF/YER057c/UK114 family)